MLPMDSGLSNTKKGFSDTKNLMTVISGISIITDTSNYFFFVGILKVLHLQRDLCGHACTSPVRATYTHCSLCSDMEDFVMYVHVIIHLDH